MKLRNVLIVAVAVLAVNVTGAFAEGLAGSDHDFSGSVWSGGEICLPCHTPHNSDTTMGYLWNHAYPDDASFTKHEGATLQSYSLMCLGCHDGQTAIDSVGGATGGTVVSGSENIGTDLTDDHPVGIPYPSGAYSRYAPTTMGWGGAQPGVGDFLPLFGPSNQIECTTCHSPHAGDTDYFLRIDNTGSALCITCHHSETW